MITPIIIIIVLLVCCICCCCLSIGGGYFGLGYYVDQQVADGKVQLQTKPFLGMCPTDWTKKSFANGTVCVEPGAYAKVDRCLNTTMFTRGECPEQQKRVFEGENYCLENLENNPENYFGWGCLKGLKTSDPYSVKLPISNSVTKPVQ